MAKTTQSTPKTQKPEQVYLTFQYEGGVNTVILAYYWNNTFYLPVNSLFEVLKINHTNDLNRYVITGNYLNKSENYKIDLKNNVALIGNQRLTLQKNDYLIEKLDYYLRPKVYKQLFDLSFIVNFNKLSLHLTSPDELPVVKLYQQEQKRSNVINRPLLTGNYPLEYGEQKHLVNGGFVDYDLNTNYNKNSRNFNFNLRGGGEILGGDIQGNLFGVYSANSYSLQANSLRWRYVLRTNPYLKSIVVGNIQSDGIIHLPVSGIHMSNEPVNNRYVYGKYSLSGVAQPSSIIELYLNNQLIQFQKTDELGRYHFSIPLTYGSSNLNLKIYGPNGNVTEWNKLVQIPYSFIPKNTINYNVNAGETRYNLSSNYQRNKVIQTNVKYGISNWMTAQFGVDYVNYDTHSSPIFYTTINTRIATQYLLSADIVPNDLYRIKAQVTYPKLASWEVKYTRYDGFGVFNSQQAKQLVNADLFIPLHLSKIPLTLQANGSLKDYSSYHIYNYNFGLNTNYHQINLSANYSTYLLKNTSENSNKLSKLSTAISTNILGSTFIRGQLDYDFNYHAVDNWMLMLSRRLSHWGYVSLVYRKNIRSNFNYIGASIRFNFDKFHAYSSAQSYNRSINFSQSFQGSVGYDRNYEKVFLDNLSEVGSSDVTMRMYVDSNNNNQYDKGEQVLKDDAIRLLRSEQWLKSKSGVKRYIHLNPYRRYNAEIIEAQITNPLLVPKFDKFSFVTDPNAFKKIDIPFYSTGVISGSVSSVNKKNKKEPISGLKVILRKN
ncbi:MAG TPA: hypothetical protein VKA34_05675, partial [Balneolales bacterium]|nr:hypothetical protein [Balneolales bacterium]